jgi:SPP1 family predicted phage head-tail adaptor
MRAGQLKKRVRIQEATEGSADALGEKPITWSDISTRAEVWAAVLPQSGREFYRAQQTHPQLTHLISIRYRSDVTEANRLILGTRELEIASVQNVDEANRELLIVCVEHK